MESDLVAGSLTEFYEADSVFLITSFEREVIRSVKFLGAGSQAWPEEFFEKIFLAKEIVIHLGGWVYKGYPFDFIDLDQDKILHIRFYSALKNERESMVYLKDIPHFILEEFGRPLLIKDGSWNLIHLAFATGFIDFFAWPEG